MPRLTHRARALSFAASLLLALAGTTPLWAQTPAAVGAAARNTLPLKVARTETFTTTKGTWISLDVSPDGQTIVFDLLGHLYTMPASGGTATAITSGLAYDAQPRFSPDGKRIVFVSDRSGGDNLWTISLDKSDTVQLTKGNDNLYVSPEWTPDGKYIVASKSGGLGGTAKLWLYNVDGGTGVALLPQAPPQLKTRRRRVRQYGRYIWYAARQGDWQYNAIGAQYQLFVYDRENGKTSQMSTRGGSAFRPALSPDGKYLVYATREKTKTGLRIRDLETQQERLAGLSRAARRDRVPRPARRVSRLHVHARLEGGHRHLRRRDLARARRQERAGQDSVRGRREARDGPRGEVRLSRRHERHVHVASGA